MREQSDSAETALPACQYAIPIQGESVPVTIFRRSAVVDWSRVITKNVPRGTKTKRGKVGSMTARSGQRLVFALANSPKDWGVMATLTFRHRVMDGRQQLKDFMLRMKQSGYGDLHYAWVREYQFRGAVHYHFLWELEGVEARGLLEPFSIERKASRGNVRFLVRGEFERVVVSAWRYAVDDQSDEFRAFQQGGIVELLKSCDGAAAYFGSYLAKASQKILPADAEASGRWWFVDGRAKPIAETSGHLTEWHLPIPLKIIFNRDDLSAAFTTEPRESGIPQWFKRLQLRLK